MREVTWSRIGTDVSEKETVSEVLEKAGLNYTVHTEKILIPNGTEVKGSVATVKSTGEICGIVSDKYSVYQNDEALDFVNNIPDIQFERAGETHKGMIYLIGKLPDLEVLGDKFTPHVIFQTSHNGNYPLKATICPLRFVCQNQFAWSFRQMRNHITVRHSSLMHVKIAQAQVVINDTAQYMNGFTNTAEELALLHISETTRHAIIDAFFDSARELTERQKDAMEAQRAFFNQCYAADDNGNFLGTGWGMLNATADFVTHKPVKQTKTVNESRFEKVTFDHEMMNKMLSLINTMAR